MKASNVKCEKCGVDFLKRICEIKRRKRHFCSTECSNNRRGSEHKSSIEVNCKGCNKFFYKKYYFVKNSENHYCSKQCHSKSLITRVEVNCAQCNCSFFIIKSLYKGSDKNYCCSVPCAAKFRTKKVEVNCLICDKKFFKSFDRLAKRPRHCCSPECAIVLVKFHKNWGGRRSKLEIYVEERLKKEFNLNFLFNETTIGYELDIHIPDMNYAIEINGITHYEPIYGESILKKRLEVDQNKANECKKQNIELSILNVSGDKNYPHVLERRYNEIKNLILERIMLLNYNQDNSISKEI